MEWENDKKHFYETLTRKIDSWLVYYMLIYVGMKYYINCSHSMHT